MRKEFRGGGSKGVLGVGSKVQFWGPISLCLCAFLGLDLKDMREGRGVGRPLRGEGEGEQSDMSEEKVSLLETCNTLSGSLNRDWRYYSSIARLHHSAHSKDLLLTTSCKAR